MRNKILLLIGFLFATISFEAKAQSLLGYSYDKLHKHYLSDNSLSGWRYNDKEKTVMYTTTDKQFLYIIMFTNKRVAGVSLVSDAKHRAEAEKVYRSKYATDKRFPGELIDWENERRFKLFVKGNKLFVNYIALYQDQ